MARGYLLVNDDYKASVPMGELYMAGNDVPTVFTDTGVFAKILGTTILSTGLLFTSPVSNQLMYSECKCATQHLHCGATISFSLTGRGGAIVEFRAVKNGNIHILPSIAVNKTGAGNDIRCVSSHFMVQLSVGDYIEMWVANNTNGSPVTVLNMSMFAYGLPFQGGVH